MKIKWLYILLFGIIVSSCDTKEKLASEEKNVYSKPFLFNMTHFFLDEEFNISFPFWFNDSIIKANRIQGVTRTIYSSLAAEDTLKIPEEIQFFQFDEEGKIESLKIEHYYDNQLMGEMEYQFNNIDEYGFAEVKAISDVHNDEDQEILDNYTIHRKEEYQNKFLVYSRDEGDYLFYMLKQKDWGPLSIDSILQPSSDDKIVLGSPEWPSKRYSVSNRVNEFDVIEYIYEGTAIKKINYENYPFSYHRSILYNQTGQCIGFTDSTFSDERYLTRRESMFHIKNELPVRLIHEIKSDNSATGYYQFETFEYIKLDQKDNK